MNLHQKPMTIETQRPASTVGTTAVGAIEKVHAQLQAAVERGEGILRGVPGGPAVADDLERASDSLCHVPAPAQAGGSISTCSRWWWPSRLLRRSPWLG